MLHFKLPVLGGGLLSCPTIYPCEHEDMSLGQLEALPCSLGAL